MNRRQLWDELNESAKRVQKRFDAFANAGAKPAAQLDEFNKTATGIGERIGRSYRIVTNVGIDDGGTNIHRMNHILADNPGMSKEDAFFQAVIEIAERTL